MCLKIIQMFKLWLRRLFQTFPLMYSTRSGLFLLKSVVQLHLKERKVVWKNINTYFDSEIHLELNSISFERYVLYHNISINRYCISYLSTGYNITTLRSPNLRTNMLQLVFNCWEFRCLVIWYFIVHNGSISGLICYFYYIHPTCQNRHIFL